MKKLFTNIWKAIVDHWNRIDDKWRFLYASLVIFVMILVGAMMMSVLPAIAIALFFVLSYLFNGLLILLVIFTPPWRKGDWLVVPLWLPALLSGKVRDWINTYD